MIGTFLFISFSFILGMNVGAHILDYLDQRIIKSQERLIESQDKLIEEYKKLISKLKENL